MSITTTKITNYKCDNCTKEIKADDAITNGQVINLLNLPYHDSDRSLNLDIKVNLENGVDNSPCICQECFNKKLSNYLTPPQTNQS